MASHVYSKRTKVARVLINVNLGTLTGQGNGSGFFISTDGTFFTCAHVALVLKGAEIKKLPIFAQTSGTEHEKYMAFYSSCIDNPKAVFEDGQEVELQLEKLDMYYDFAIFKAKTGKIASERILETDFSTPIDYGMHTNFVGYPMCPGYAPDKNPFAFNLGYVSAFPEIQIEENGKYEHIQINALNLGGNSGGPLFIGESEAVVGIVNGNWSQYNVAYATSLKLLREKSACYF